ncbi:hypothetical protein [Pseudoroseomonas cervicalis]|uniref:hypothetical protein n=1 Tax=Teichococcus cervicalis TaxID=204525 RepID=UPI0027D861DA|nr:hypothetical protein [Pseudoroseomonas cervicalis]
MAEDAGDRAAWNDVYDRATTVIVGGGGLLEMPKFEESLSKITREKSKVILWGCGHNAVKLESWAGLRKTYTFKPEDYALAGTRDDGVSSRWVPCVTCMSPLFDRSYEIEHDVVFFANKGMKNNSSFMPKDIPQGKLLGNMRHGMDKIIAFLGSAETVVTSSFHGAYWATLLGRKVVAIPTSSKFYGLRHAVPLCHPLDWQRAMKLARSYPEALGECREANIAFKNDVMKLVNEETLAH